AKPLDPTTVPLACSGRALGTPGYMAPEQIRGAPAISHKTDLYALGVVLYQLLTGEAPFQGPSAIVLAFDHLTQPPPRPSGKVPEIPEALDSLVVQLMAKAPADRPWDAVEVAHVLTQIRDEALQQRAKTALSLPHARRPYPLFLSWLPQ